MAMPIAELAEERPTLIFAASVKHALALEKVLRRYTGEGLVSTVSGDMPRDVRKATIESFQRGKIRFLVNCALLTEGFDAPHTSCIAMCRPTKSRPLYAQIVGRGTRLAPGKTDCLVLDFKGNADQHKLVSVVDLLGRELSVEAKQRVELALVSGEGNVLSALQHEENRAHAEAEAARLTVKAVYSETEVDWSGRGPRKAVGAQRKSRSGIAEDKLDPFRWFGLEREVAPIGWRATPCTEAQKSVLSRNGIDVRNLTRGDASDLIEEMTSRANKGLCTPRQAKFLAIFGRDTSVTFEQASTWIDQLKQRGRPGMRWK
jgi:superfamily II DNA/RNA helicase